MKIARIVFVLSVFIIIAVMANCINNIYDELATIRVEMQNYSDIPSPAQIQQLLNLIEPKDPVKVDGKIGKNTIAKWDRIICNQYAAETF